MPNAGSLIKDSFILVRVNARFDTIYRETVLNFFGGE